MGSDVSQGPADGSGAAYVGQLADHARQLQREARVAIARGEYGRASALIGDAELLAEDVHDLVDAIEDRHAGALINMAAQNQAAHARTATVRRPRALRIAIGASLAMSFALVEC